MSGALKVNTAYTNSMRGTVILRSSSRKNKPCKSLVVTKKSTGGRNSFGQITTRFRGGANKNKYRLIAFKKTIFDIKANVVSLEYDPNRTAEIALLKYDNGKMEYMIAVDGMKVGDTILNMKNADDVSLKNGMSLPLSEIPIGTNVCCVELKAGCGAKLARSAGAYVKLAGKENGYAVLKLLSGETRLVPAECMATIGIVSNIQHQNTKDGKAGRRRWAGFRPHTRGECMNPVDHPLGGRTRGGIPRSPWGQCAKGLKTRTRKFTNKYIVSRKKKN
ncbi:MAG: 50S ribosomal protein L2 [Rickettsiales bacterium]|nr:50S ribosomal protein L2 [Rickettsiales bacterium]